MYSEKTNMVEGIVTKCQTNDNGIQITIKAKEKIVLNYYNNFTCTPGTKIKAIGEIKKPKQNTIFNLFNYQKYLYSEKINYQLTATNIKIINNII